MFGVGILMVLRFLDYLVWLFALACCVSIICAVFCSAVFLLIVLHTLPLRILVC